MRRASLLLFLAATAAMAACHDMPAAPDYGPAIGNAASFGLWSPGANDDCTKAQHDAYTVVGPDHKRYPTWHPPIDPATGCSFGHDHGRDPRGSALYREAGPIPFAYTNNLHELVYHIRCTDGTEMHITMLAAIGTPGQFTRSCDGATIAVGPATPANSPDGGGQRIIADRTCVDRDIL